MLLAESTESLAGRATFLQLLPFSVSELTGGKLRPAAIEIKSAKTFSADFVHTLERWMRFFGQRPEDYAVAYAGDRCPTGKGIQVLAWTSRS